MESMAVTGAETEGVKVIGMQKEMQRQCLDSSQWHRLQWTKRETHTHKERLGDRWSVRNLGK